MPKKTATKTTKKTAKTTKEKEVKTVAPEKEQTPIEALPETQSAQTPPVPTPDTSASPDVKLVLNQSAPDSVASIQPATTTPSAENEPSAPIASPTDIPTITTEPDVATGVANENFTQPDPGTITTTTLTDPSVVPIENLDDFEPEHKGGGIRILIIFVTALLVGGLGVGGFLYYSQMNTNNTTPIVVEPTTEPAAEPTKDPVATGSAEEAELASLSVQILNGSGTAGEAARVRDALQTGGFAKFSLGNADSYDYTDTTVQVKTGLPGSVFEAVQSSLTTYTVVEETVLPATSSHDIIIVVGQRK